MAQPVLALVDASIYWKPVCELAAWASRTLNAPVRLLHILDKSEPDILLPQDIIKDIDNRFRNDFIGKIQDSSASYACLMQELGQMVLDEAAAYLKKHTRAEIDTRLRYDTLSDAIRLYSKTSLLTIIGKRGQQSAWDEQNINAGKNFETLVRASRQPVLAASLKVRQIKKILILYDEDFEIKRALDYIKSHHLLKNKSCLVAFPTDVSSTILKEVNNIINELREEKIDASPLLIEDEFNDNTINKIITEHKVHLTLLSAFNQSKIKQLIFGSTREILLQKIATPILILRNEP